MTRGIATVWESGTTCNVVGKGGRLRFDVAVATPDHCSAQRGEESFWRLKAGEVIFSVGLPVAKVFGEVFVGSGAACMMEVG